MQATSSSLGTPRLSLYNLIEERMPPVIRWSILVYVVVYRIITPAVASVVSGEMVEYFWLRLITNGLAEIAFILPIIAFKRVGFFHPLAFGPLYAMAFDVAFQPVHLFLPFVLSAKPWFAESPSWSIVLQSLNRYDYALYNSLYNIATSAFYMAMYVGFYTFNKDVKINTDSQKSLRGYVPATMLYLVIAIAAGWLFIRSRGGIEAQLLSFYQGRFESLSGSGAFTVVTKVASVAILLWLASQKNAERSIVFWLFAVTLIPIYWLVDGSRSSVILMFMTMLMVISFKRGSIPIRAGGYAAVAAFTLFGVLGILRQDYHATSVDYSVFDLSRASEWVAASQGETNKRAAEEGDLAAFVTGRETGLLGGKSYLSIIAYPIPRAIWADKPKNIFTYNTWVAFKGNQADDLAPDIWGIPVGAVSEAYWNFGWIGILSVGFIVGLGLRKAMLIFKSHATEPWACVLYIEFLLYFSGGSRWALYLIQNLSGLLMLIILARMMRTFIPKGIKLDWDGGQRGFRRKSA